MEPWPDDLLDLRDADGVIDVFERAAAVNDEDTLREGGCVRLPARGRLVASGDLHDHLPNLTRLRRLAELDGEDPKYLVFQEVIHGGRLVNGMDLSVRTLARVAYLRTAYREHVRLILSNHELSQVIGGGSVSKNGVSVVQAFNRGMSYLYDEKAVEVNSAMCRFIRSLPLAISAANGLMVSHSLPDARRIDQFDTEILEHRPTESDLKRGGSAYLMVWGRDHDRDLVERLGAVWQVRQFVLGHEPAPEGYRFTAGDRVLILSSDDELGVALDADLSESPDRETLTRRIVPLSAVDGV